ncbi:O-antigen ligase family protein [Geomesophilobacter sediminis]|uniref:O-antigen ligase family protein n=1 Tax=Geomesophilobacter sediminis TaxID=2798584 RepID=A0A8J7JA53_9BACT|nr:O-antigen ligase family protein [Geomesophilobacter sediminis]MBJ6723681.1 O-antigen ligase family protein [Geomesophilobacter sediminis]
MLYSGLILFVFLMIIRPQDFVYGLMGQPLVFVTMGLVLVAWLLSGVEKAPFKTAQDKYCFMLMTLMVISTVPTLWTELVVTTFSDTSKLVLIYLFIVTIVDTEERFRSITWIIMLLMTAVAGMGVLQYYGYDIVGTGMQFAADKGIWQIRGVGNFDNPNDLAYSVVLVVPFSVGMLLRGGGLQKAASLVMLAIAVYCIVLTGSRGGQLALVFSLTAFLYFWVTNPRLKKMTAYIGLVGVLAAFSVQTSDYRNDESSMGRVEAWDRGMELLTSHPLLGVGKGQFREYHKRDTHNSYVRAGSELGILGLYAFLGTLFYSVFNAAALLKSEEFERLKPYVLGIISFFGGFAVASIFSTRTYDIVFLTVVALSSAVCRIASRDPRIGDGRFTCDLWNRRVAGLTVGALFIWKLFLIQVW